MKKTLFVMPLLLVVLSLLAANVYFIQPASAGATLEKQITDPLKTVGDTAGYSPAGPDQLPTTIGRIIKIAIGLLGVIMVIIVIYAGFLWMTAGGDPEQVKKAKEWMINATIGLLIVIAAYSISSFVIAKVFCAMGGTGAGC